MYERQCNQSMCGRYFIDISNDILREICKEVAQKVADQYEQLTIKYEGDVFPSDVVAVQDASDSYVPMQWGFTNFDGKLLINARSETAAEKPTFRESMLERRCLIPASGYYEWHTQGKAKTKYAFAADESPLWLAGCYRKEHDTQVPRFVILTREATPELATIHNRMPLIIPKDYAQSWLCDGLGALDHAQENLSFTTC
jgi:putative SOS response-associated peptidase YedK